MSKETTPNKLPYPEDTDAPDGPTQLKALAEQLEKVAGLRGHIASGGTVSRGKGFTAEKIETGYYKIVATKAFSVVPAVVVTPENSLAFFAVVAHDAAEPTKEIRVRIFNNAGEKKDCGFDFVATTPTGE